MLMGVAVAKISKPGRLLPGDKIGIIAPSSPFDLDKFQKGLSLIEEIGLIPVFPENIFEAKRYLAGSDAHRARLFNAMFAEAEIKGIMCARGGYGALRMLSGINFDDVAAHPKILIGCSDVTVLLNALHVQCGLVSLHGPMIESLSTASDATKQSLQDALFNESAVILHAESKRVIRPGKVAGVLVGGNLTTLCHMIGTPFAPDASGGILLLEDIAEAPYRIDRMLTQLKLAGFFENICGIALGSFKSCGELETIYQIFDDLFSANAFPILAGFHIGHDEPNMTVPFGIPALLDTFEGTLSFSESPFFDK